MVLVGFSSASATSLSVPVCGVNTNKRNKNKERRRRRSRKTQTPVCSSSSPSSHTSHTSHSHVGVGSAVSVCVNVNVSSSRSSSRSRSRSSSRSSSRCHASLWSPLDGPGPSPSSSPNGSGRDPIGTNSKKKDRKDRTQAAKASSASGTGTGTNTGTGTGTGGSDPVRERGKKEGKKGFVSAAFSGAVSGTGQLISHAKNFALSATVSSLSTVSTVLNARRVAGTMSEWNHDVDHGSASENNRAAEGGRGASSTSSSSTTSTTSWEDLARMAVSAVTDEAQEEEEGLASAKPTVSVKSFLRDVSDETKLLRNFRMMSSMSEMSYYVNELTVDDVRKRYGLDLYATSKDYKLSISDKEFDEVAMFDSGDGMTVPFQFGQERMRDMQQEMEKHLDLEEMVAESLERQQELERSLAGEEEEEEELRGEKQQASAVHRALDTAKSFASFVSGYTLSMGQQQLQSASSKVSSGAGKKKIQDNDPCEWIVADHPSKPVRYIVLQGSDSLDHWVTNLSFEPVDFEGEDLNVKIHVGIYKAAEKLIEQLFPAMEEHMREHGDKARFVFCGHSLGGAIASALVMMLVHRQQLKVAQVEAIYTYGCPAFICENCSCNCKSGECTCTGGNTRLLERLNIPSSLFKHLCMHRDIVPRAFACDYTLIKNIMTQMDTYKNYGCLKGSKEMCYMPSLYRHVGDVYFIQPDTEFLQFARPEGDSPMLPGGHGIWKMVEPPRSLKLAMNTMNKISRSLQNEWAFGDDLELYNYASDVDHAIGEIMNNPHPLEILKDTNAYGHEGGVSRFHKPKNYTRALGVILNVKDSKK